MKSLKILCLNHEILYSLALRDISIKYKSTVLGFAWLVIQPLLMLLTYTFVFGIIFKSRWGGSGTIIDYVLLLFSGLTVYTCFSDTVNRVTSVIKSQPNLVKKVVFPLEVLPIVIVASSLYSSLVNFILIVVLSLVFKFSIPSTALLLPIYLIPFLLMLAGFAWCISSLSVFLPDLSQVITFVSSLLLFLSPVFFPLTSVPEQIRFLLYLNPITIPVQIFRQLIILGEIPNIVEFLVYSFASIVVYKFGFKIFSRTKIYFADVI